jgi:hypothetical protein
VTLFTLFRSVYSLCRLFTLFTLFTLNTVFTLFTLFRCIYSLCRRLLSSLSSLVIHMHHQVVQCATIFLRFCRSLYLPLTPPPPPSLPHALGVARAADAPGRREARCRLPAPHRTACARRSLPVRAWWHNGHPRCLRVRQDCHLAVTVEVRLISHTRALPCLRCVFMIAPSRANHAHVHALGSDVRASTITLCALAEHRCVANMLSAVPLIALLPPMRL